MKTTKTKSAFGTLFPLPVTTMVASGIAALACGTTHAQPLSSESFSGYTVGTQLQNDTPSPAVAGYTGNWALVDWGDQGPGMLAGSLSYGGAGYAAGVGNHIGVAADAGGIQQGTSGRVNRQLDSSLVVDGTTTGTRYLSFLFQSGQEYGSTIYQVLALYNGTSGDVNPRALVAGLTQNGGQSGSQYDFGVNEAYSNFGVTADTGVHLFVAGFNLSATSLSDSVTMWLDPMLGGGAPAGGMTVSGQDIAFDHLDFSDYSGNSANWDEIRWGTTFDSVTVPEPSTGALALCAAGLAAFLRRRKNQVS